MMEVDSAQPKTNSTANSGEVIKTEEEEILVYVNVDDANDDFSAEDLKSFKVVGLDTDEPIIQVGDKFFGGSWDEVVGTAVFFKETTPQPKRCYFSDDVPKPLEYFGKTQKSLNLKRAFVTNLNKNSNSDKSVEAEKLVAACKEEELAEVFEKNTNLDNVVSANTSEKSDENFVKIEARDE